MAGELVEIDVTALDIDMQNANATDYLAITLHADTLKGMFTTQGDYPQELKLLDYGYYFYKKLINRYFNFKRERSLLRLWLCLSLRLF